MVQANTQSTFTTPYVQVIIEVLHIDDMSKCLINDQLFMQEKSNVSDDRLPSSPRFDASTVMKGGAAATTASDNHVVQNKHMDKDVTDLTTPPRQPVFDVDYILTDEDIETTTFLRRSYEDAEVVDVGETTLKVHHLLRNVSKGFIFDEVTPYSAISMN
jgi:hypothetical protein